MRKFVTMIISGALAISPACARDWPDAGGWSIAEGDDACGMMQDYEGKGETELLLFLNLDGKVVVSIKNSDWSAVDGQKYELEYFLNGKSYGGGAAVGWATSYKKGFLATFGDDFAHDFAAGTSLLIYRGDVLVDQLSLKGTAAGMAMVRRCMAALRADKDAVEREKRRFSHIADDPFASDRTETEKEKFGTTRLIPRGSQAGWFSDADYPSRAQREGREGTTTYKLEVGSDGRVTKCDITSSSGHADLDEAACRIISKRARFDSSAGSGSFEGSQVWHLPE